MCSFFFIASFWWYHSYLDCCQDSREYVYIKCIFSRMGMHMQSNWEIIFFYFDILDLDRTMH